MDIERRRVLRLILASLAAAPLAGACGRRGKEWAPHPPPPPGDPLQTLKVRGYRGLADLPYFELDGNGHLRLTVDDLPRCIDFHTHLAFNMFLAPKVDLLRRTGETRYMIDCDGAQPPCTFDLNVYMNHIADGAMLDRMESVARGMVLFGTSASETYTIPNLVAEMDAMGFEKAVLLAIAPGFPFRDDLTTWWADALRRSGSADRFILFGSVKPTSDSAPDDLRKLAGTGIRGVKLHPTMQRFYPDDPRAMSVYEVCEELGLPVFFHAGRAGIEPEFTRKYAVMKNYVGAVSEFPRVRFIFGHSGARDYREAIPIARQHANVWMDVEGQGVGALREMLTALGPEKLVFGSDWPFYPLAATLAKVLIVTGHDQPVRDMILSGNARRFFGEA